MMVMFNRSMPATKEVDNSPIPRGTPSPPPKPPQPRKLPAHWPSPILDCPVCKTSANVQPVETLMWSCGNSESSANEMLKRRDEAHTARISRRSWLLVILRSSTPTWYCTTVRLTTSGIQLSPRMTRRQETSFSRAIGDCDSPQKWLHFKASEELDARAQKRKP